MNWDRSFDEKILRAVVGDDRIESLVDRRDTSVPETFVPSARGFAIVSDGLLFLVHPMAHLGMLGGWVGGKRKGLYRAATDDGYFIAVPRYEGRAGGPDLWGIERLCLREKIPAEVLAFGFGPTPIFHRDPTIAKAIAKRCHPYPREEAQLLRWIPITGEVAANSENELRPGEKPYVVFG